MYRALFKFGVFNAVQSRCFDKVCYATALMYVSSNRGLQVMYSDDNMVSSVNI